MPVEHSKKNGRAIIRMVANGTITLADLQVGGEVIKRAEILAVWWTGPWNVVRGANTVLQLTDGQDGWNLDGEASIKDGSTQSLVFTHGVPAGTIIIEVNKIIGDEP